MAGIFALGITLFFIFRAVMVPEDFGLLGHYRAGALADNMLKPIRYAGEAACVDCHSAVREKRMTARHAGVHCEACHGPLANHAADVSVAPARPPGRATCLKCHAARPSKPAGFPQVIPEDHAPEGDCIVCHVAHAPKIQ